MFCELVPTIVARKSRSIDILKGMHANVNPLLRTPPIRQALSRWIFLRRLQPILSKFSPPQTIFSETKRLQYIVRTFFAPPPQFFGFLIRVWIGKFRKPEQILWIQDLRTSRLIDTNRVSQNWRIFCGATRSCWRCCSGWGGDLVNFELQTWWRWAPQGFRDETTTSSSPFLNGRKLVGFLTCCWYSKCCLNKTYCNLVYQNVSTRYYRCSPPSTQVDLPGDYAHRRINSALVPALHGMSWKLLGGPMDVGSRVHWQLNQGTCKMVGLLLLSHQVVFRISGIWHAQHIQPCRASTWPSFGSKRCRLFQAPVLKARLVSWWLMSGEVFDPN